MNLCNYQYSVATCRALRRLCFVGGGFAPPAKRKSAARGRSSCLMSYTCCKCFSAKNFCYKAIHVQQLVVAVVWPQVREENYYVNRLSIAKDC